MHTVAEILAEKDGAVIEIDGGATVFEAVKAMVAANVGALLVTDGTEIAGIFTERDYARKIVLLSRSSRETPVREAMTSQVMFVRPEQTSEECMALMTGNRVRHLPVMDQGKLVGLVSIGDLVKDVISEQKFLIEQLEQYIAR